FCHGRFGRCGLVSPRVGAEFPDRVCAQGRGRASRAAILGRTQTQMVADQLSDLHAETKAAQRKAVVGLQLLPAAGLRARPYPACPDVSQAVRPPKDGSARHSLPHTAMASLGLLQTSDAWPFSCLIWPLRLARALTAKFGNRRRIVVVVPDGRKISPHPVLIMGPFRFMINFNWLERQKW